MKFYLDEDLAPAIGPALRKRSVDAVSAHEVGHIGVGYAEQLTFAAGQGRCWQRAGFLSASLDFHATQAPNICDGCQGISKRSRRLFHHGTTGRSSSRAEAMRMGL